VRVHVDRPVRPGNEKPLEGRSYSLGCLKK
jgi:hypothetical protein